VEVVLTRLNAPFPYFGGKSKVADEVWRRFAQTKRYIEPFCGSAAVLLQRPGGAPSGARDEVINDLDGFITNFYRTVKQQPDDLVELMDYTVSELDLHARRDWLQGIEDELVENLRADPHYCHVKAAAWWCWGACQWIGSGWPESKSNKMPQIAKTGGRGLLSTKQSARKNVLELSKRLENVKIICGDWKRCLGNCALNEARSERSNTSIFFDPPYPDTNREVGIYSKDSMHVGYKVEKWCKEHQSDPTLRIAICGYDNTHELPEWDKYHWNAPGNFKNANREVIWFSPQCRNDYQKTIF
jgi:DNA adenine methylase